jgi:hypothetical protein
MKIRTLLATNAALLLMMALSSQADDKMMFKAKPGKDMKMRIEGTSTVHDWQVESPIIGGYLKVGPGFPVEPGQAATPGKMDATGEVKIPVNSLKSIEKDGKPYSDKMDEIMLGKLKSASNAFILFRLTELVLKETAKTKEDPYVFEVSGDLTVAGTTNKAKMTVNITPLGDRKLKLTGTTSVKMSDYKVEPPVLVGILSTGDAVKLIFDWPLVLQAPAAAAK